MPSLLRSLKLKLLSHRRLCGGVTCHDCSRFINNQFAQLLLKGHIGDNIPVNELRCCKDCFALLERKCQMMQHHQLKCLLEENYVKIRLGTSPQSNGLNYHDFSVWTADEPVITTFFFRACMDRCLVLKPQYINSVDACLSGVGCKSCLIRA